MTNTAKEARKEIIAKAKTCTKPVLYAEYIDWRNYWIISNPDRADLPIFYAHDIQAEIAKLSDEYNIVKA